MSESELEEIELYLGAIEFDVDQMVKENPMFKIVAPAQFVKMGEIIGRLSIVRAKLVAQISK